LPADEAEARGLPFRFRAADGSYLLGGAELVRARSTGLPLRVLRTWDEEEIPVRFHLPHEGAVNNHPPEDARLAVLARLIAEERAGGDVHIRFLGRNRSVPADGFVLDRAGGNRCYVWQAVPSEHAPAGPLLERFRELHALFADPDTRVVLALGSGGLKLFAHAPVLRLLERLELAPHIDEIWGSSGGAVVSLLYSHGLSPQAIEQAGYDLYTGRYRMEIHPSRFSVLRNLLRDALIPTSHPSSAGFIDLTGGLSRMLDAYCSALRPRRPFYCVAFNLEKCRSEVLTPLPVDPHLDELCVRTDAREAVLASSAVPLLSWPQRVMREGREVHYVDGSTTEDVPLHSALRKWDLDRAAGVEQRSRLVLLYVKLTSSPSSYQNASGSVGKLRLLQMVASAGIHTMHQRDRALAQQRPDVELMALELADASPDFFDIRRIPGFIRAAKECFPEQLAAIEKSLRDRRAGDPIR
jgi:predicted acylesterase/phospholipase RssA